jgi:prepilin-type N-terminal cleavage/methylation domain-containing protein
MKKNPNGFSLIEGLLALVIIGVIVSVGWYAYSRSNTANGPVSTEPLMIVRYAGGLCSDGKVCSSEYKLYEDGSFQGHTKLESQEVTQLKEIISNTDFLEYKNNPKPNCASAYDGTDEFLTFPQKYPDKSFMLCGLQIPHDDPAINFINGLIQNHREE